MKNEICTISIGEKSLDQDYTFYEDGSVELLYDEDYYRRINRKASLKVKDISDSKKKKILENCPIELKDKIVNLFKN